MNTLGTRATDFLSLYALDLTCAQYGYTNPLQPWEDYHSHRVSANHHINTTPFGTALTYALSRCSKPGFEGAIALVQRELSRWLLNSLCNWEMRMGLSAFDMLSLEDEIFEDVKFRLLACLQQAMQDFLATEKMLRRPFY